MIIRSNILYNKKLFKKRYPTKKNRKSKIMQYLSRVVSYRLHGWFYILADHPISLSFRIYC